MSAKPDVATSSATAGAVSLTPISGSERILALDVIRGFALLGIFLMNVEFFNRPLAELQLGLPNGVQGLDYWAGWFVYVFVRSKFWTMFSLLFGMGFAVMMMRAQDAGRGFFAPYLRRTLALAAFGVLHFIFIWAGDILFAYAMGAVALMVVFYVRPRIVLSLALALCAVGLVLGLAAMAGHDLPWQPFAGIGIPLLLFGIAIWAVRKWPVNGLRNAGVLLFLLPFLLPVVGGTIELNLPPPQVREATAIAAAKTPEEKKKLEEKRDERLAQIAEKREAIATETRVMSGGTYAEAVRVRISQFGETFIMNLFFTIIVLGMFLLGAWFVRSGVMRHPEQHLPLFRKLALIGLPVGIGLTLLSTSIGTNFTLDGDMSLFAMASGLFMMASLPACLGYVGLVVVLLHGRFGTWLRKLGPAGRMALTNYLTQSVVGTLFFYGYGLGHWGTGRAWQVVFVVVVYALQIAFSHWWLARFRFGPMEWLWRSFTYLEMPPMRRHHAQPA